MVGAIFKMSDYIKKVKLATVQAELECDLSINKVVLGVDVAMHNTGLAVIRTTDNYLYLDILHNIMVPKNVDLLTGVDLFLAQLREFKNKVAQKYKLDKTIIEDCYLKFNVEVLKKLARFGILVYPEMKEITTYSQFMKPTTARNLVNFKKSSKEIKGTKLKKEIIVYVNNILGTEIKDDNQADCFDDKTEILTKKGWKFFKDLQKTDRIMSMDPETSIADYYPIKNIIIQKYKGIMYEYTSSTLNFCVTPNHKLLIKTTKIPKYIQENKEIKITRDNKGRFAKGTKMYSDRGKWKWHLKPVKDIQTTYWWIKRTCKWEGTECVNYIIPPINFVYKKIGKYRATNFKKTVMRSYNRVFAYDKKLLDIDIWLDFLGWFISEGCLTGSNGYINSVIITQTHKDNRISIGRTLKAIGFKFSDYDSKDFVINNKQLAQHLLNTCYTNKAVHKSYTKKVPQFIKTLSPRLINIFLNSYCKGNGWFSRDSRRYSTSSKQLADDLQELILKIGKLSSVFIRKKAIGKKKFIVDHWTSQKRPNYVISELKYTDAICFVKQIKKKNYNGKVYCVETEPYHTVLVRRNYQVMWSGNSVILSLAGLVIENE